MTHGLCAMQTILNFDTRSELRGHRLKLTKEFTRKSTRKHFFADRVVNSWNSLPDDLIMEPNLDIFKNRLDLLGQSTVLI